MALTYATAEQLRTYMGLTAAALPDEEAERLLTQAEKDVDRVWGPMPYGEARRWVLADLNDQEAQAITDATCAQAEYRNLMGEEYFIQRQPKRSSGPDFSVEGGGGRIGPKVYEELQAAGLLSQTGRAVVGPGAGRSGFFRDGPV